jgi:hypothetical protein
MIDKRTRHELRGVAGFLAPTLRDALRDTRKLPVSVSEHMRLRCAVEAKLRADGQVLAAVAPWMLTARLHVNHA